MVNNNTWPLSLFIACVVGLGLSAGSGFAADPRTDATNRGVVELETGGSSGISVRMAEELAALIDDGATRRVLPVELIVRRSCGCTP